MFVLDADRRLAFDSRDYAVPAGGMMDDTGGEAFLDLAKQNFAGRGSCAVLDLGCSSGRIVVEALKKGMIACGLEGLEFPLARKKGGWATLAGSHLFTCDITRPFTLSAAHVLAHTGHSVQPYRFDLACMFEVAEHIEEKDLPQLISNVLKHLTLDGWWAMSISKQGGYHHRTVRPKTWWDAKFAEFGLVENRKAVEHFGDSFPRGLNEPDSWVTVLHRADQYPGGTQHG